MTPREEVVAAAIREALRWFADYLPLGVQSRHSGQEMMARVRAANALLRSHVGPWVPTHRDPLGAPVRQITRTANDMVIYEDRHMTLLALGAHDFRSHYSPIPAAPDAPPPGLDEREHAGVGRHEPLWPYWWERLQRPDGMETARVLDLIQGTLHRRMMALEERASAGGERR